MEAAPATIHVGRALPGEEARTGNEEDVGGGKDVVLGAELEVAVVNAG